MPLHQYANTRLSETPVREHSALGDRADNRPTQHSPARSPHGRHSGRVTEGEPYTSAPGLGSSSAHGRRTTGTALQGSWVAPEQVSPVITRPGSPYGAQTLYSHAIAAPGQYQEKQDRKRRCPCWFWVVLAVVLLILGAGIAVTIVAGGVRLQVQVHLRCT
jgi:hypothetical protein